MYKKICIFCGSWECQIQIQIFLSDSDLDIGDNLNHMCPVLNTRMKTITDSLDIDCITGLDTGDK